MQNISLNIINEINKSNKDSFTKDEIIRLIEETTCSTRLPDIESNGVILSPERFQMTYNNKSSLLPRKEFLLLYYLMNNKNKCMLRHEIIRDIWGTDVIVIHRTIDVHIRKLRNKTQEGFIRTDKGLGYTWVEK